MKSIWMILLFFYCITAPGAVSGGDIPSSQRSRRGLSTAASKHCRQIWPKMASTGGLRFFLRLFKQERRLEVWLQDGGRFRLYNHYPICTFGGRGVGPKTRKGDGRAPEGFYYVAPRH